MVLCYQSTGAAHGDEPCGFDGIVHILNQTDQELRVASHYHTACYRIELLLRR